MTKPLCSDFCVYLPVYTYLKMHLPDRMAELPSVLNESPSLGTEAS